MSGHEVKCADERCTAPATLDVSPTAFDPRGHRAYCAGHAMRYANLMTFCGMMVKLEPLADAARARAAGAAGETR